MQTSNARKQSTCTPVCGLLHAKVPALGKKRGLPTWKVWKSFWVTAKYVKSSSREISGIKLCLSPIKLMYASSGDDSRTTKIFIPGGSTLRRTSSRTKAYVFAVFSPGCSIALIYLAGRSESESQRWMYDLAKILDPDFIPEPEASQFEVTVLPCPLSCAIGLLGTMGRLGIRNSGIALREPSRSADQQGKLLGAWGWRQIDHARCRLAAAALPEDDGKICVIRTTSLFPGGAGDLTVFCSKGRQLVRCLQTKTSNLLSSLSIRGHQRARRMSRSEGDLRFVFAQVAKQHEEENSADTMLMAASLPQNSTKLASSLITAGMSLAIPAGRTRSYSENNPEDVETNSTSNNSANNDSLSNNSCGSTPDESSLEDENDIESNENILLEYNTETRRVSNVSVASGVYETIADDSDADSPPRRKIVAIPPPLPPREYKMKNGRRRGGLQAFFKIQKLWRSSSDGHVAKEEDEEEDCDELETSIYSEVLDLPFPSEDDSVINHNLSTSCSNLSNKSDLDSNFPSLCASSPFGDIENILMIDSEEKPSVRHSWDATNQFKSTDDENESIYLPMCHVKTTKYDRHRGVSESGLPSRTVNRIAQNCAALSDDSIYVTMNGSDRKASLTSEIYVLVTGMEPGTSSP